MSLAVLELSEGQREVPRDEAASEAVGNQQCQSHRPLFPCVVPVRLQCLPGGVLASVFRFQHKRTAKNLRRYGTWWVRPDIVANQCISGRRRKIGKHIASHDRISLRASAFRVEEKIVNISRHTEIVFITLTCTLTLVNVLFFSGFFWLISCFIFGLFLHLHYESHLCFVRVI